MITGEQVVLPAFWSGQTKLTLTGSEFHHLIRVRRFKRGAVVWVVNGLGTAAKTRIETVDEDSLVLEVLQEENDRGELNKELTLAIANLKGDHLNMVVEKATELGVQRIIPLLTEHTIKRGLNRSRLERIAVSAMKQSRRSRLPEIQELTPFPDAVKHCAAATNLFCYANDSTFSIMGNKEYICSSNRLVIWIGPEGDWSKDEIDLASISDYTFTGLGPRRLRAETAAIHAVGLVSALLENPA